MKISPAYLLKLVREVDFCSRISGLLCHNYGQQREISKADNCRFPIENNKISYMLFSALNNHKLQEKLNNAHITFVS